MKSAEVIRLSVMADGWFIFNVRGSHHQFKHPSKKGKVTVPHPKADLPIGTVKSIFKQAGMKWGTDMKYPVYIEKDKDSDYGITVPDLPAAFLLALL